MIDFQNVPVTCQPAYTWLWNTTVTKEGIRQRIQQMYDAGIRAFYVLGEPKNFRPTVRRTYLEPEYLSEEYLELVHYAYTVAKELGMYTWLYNEGGFPSGMACGRIRKEHPELAQKQIFSQEIHLPAGIAYAQPEDTLATFRGSTRILDGTVLPENSILTRYYTGVTTKPYSIQTDNASLRNTQLFLEYTHEALKRKFGDAMGKEIQLMFDDEALMGTWTDGLDALYYQRYGYDMTDYLPWITRQQEPQTPQQYQAKIDYTMLCGSLLRENYFAPMQRWLHDHNMLSTGHLDIDNRTEGAFFQRYGNMLALLRTMDVPGVDVIWSQIDYPDAGGNCCFEGNCFFPRLASSAARQLGHSTAVSESFAVYGAQVTPEQMRFVVNYQAVRGISLFNFMVMSYGKTGALPFQYRPSFIPENPGMDQLKQINDYTARLSYILQSSKAEITTALFYPQRTICAEGIPGKAAEAAYDALGRQLEEAGVSFDIIDEEFVQQAALENGALIGEHVRYENVFVPACDLELPCVLEKLQKAGKTIQPCVSRQDPRLLSRKLVFSDGSQGYFLCSCAGETLTDTVLLPSAGKPVQVDLHTGEIWTIPCEKTAGGWSVAVHLLRGEGLLLWIPREAATYPEKPRFTPAVQLMEFKSYVNRIYWLDPVRGPENVRTEGVPQPVLLKPWQQDFSGEVTYLATLPELPEGQLRLDLGEVRYFARVFLNDKQLAEVTMPPYYVNLARAKAGDVLKIVVANTSANVCHDAAFLQGFPPEEIGPYHPKMILKEAQIPGGGLLGPVWICAEQQ